MSGKLFNFFFYFLASLNSKALCNDFYLKSAVAWPSHSKPISQCRLLKRIYTIFEIFAFVFAHHLACSKVLLDRKWDGLIFGNFERDHAIVNCSLSILERAMRPISSEKWESSTFRSRQAAYRLSPRKADFKYSRKHKLRLSDKVDEPFQLFKGNFYVPISIQIFPATVSDDGLLWNCP